MKNDDSEVRECFAYFGRVIFLAQEVEKEILNSLVLSYKNISHTRFDELLAEKFQLTFGQLKREIIQKKLFDNIILNKIEKFHELRDWLVHSYWWERTIEFYRDDLRVKIIEELDRIASEFGKLNDEIHKINSDFLKAKGLDTSQLTRELAELDQTPTFKKYRKLIKNETLIGLYLFETDNGSRIPLFELNDNTYWTICENGLTEYNLEFKKDKLLHIDKTNEIFPVTNFNPKPKTTRDWDYELDLKKNGLFIKVQPFTIKNKFAFKWSINKR